MAFPPFRRACPVQYTRGEGRRKGGDALVKLAHQRHLCPFAEGQRVAARLAQNGEFERFHHEHDDEQRRHGQQQPPVHAAHHLGKGGGVTPGERLAELKQHRNDAGDDDGARFELASDRLDNIAVFAEFDAGDLVADKMHAEIFGLFDAALNEFFGGDSVFKAVIILDEVCLCERAVVLGDDRYVCTAAYGIQRRRNAGRALAYDD